MTLLANTGQTPTGDSVPIPVDGTVVSTTTPLAANAVWDSGIMPYNGLRTIDYQIYSDVAGTFGVSYYDVLGNQLPFMPGTGTYDPSIIQSFQSTFNAKGAGVRFVYTNGPVAQTVFMFAVTLATASQETQQSAVTAISDTNKASVGKHTIQAKENGTGARKELTGTTNGSKFGIDTNDVNNGTDATGVTQLAGGTGNRGWLSGIYKALTNTLTVSVSSSALPTTASTSTNQTTANTSLASIDTKLTQQAAPAGATVTSVTTLATVVTVLAANTARKGMVFNSVTGTILIKFGTGASATSYTTRVITNGQYDAPTPCYTGVVTAIGAGTLLVTEIA